MKSLSALALFLAVSTVTPEAQPIPSHPAARLPATNAPALKPTDAVKHAKITRWKPVFRGVEICEGSATKPRPLQVRAVRINLREPTIDFLVTPSNGDAPKDAGARTTSEFLTEFKCQVALNGSVFDVFAKQKGDPMDIEGLSLSRGDLYSPPNQWDALLVSTNRRAWIARSPVEVRDAFNGLSGFYALLIKGKNNGTMTNRHPRSAVGITRNGRYLILMTVDGRQAGYSEGTSTAETAEWLRKLGAYNALNLDGGGSTALVLESADGSPVTLNRPCGPPVGRERRVANHLGVFAQRLPAKRKPSRRPPQTQSLFEKTLGPRRAGFGVPPSGGLGAAPPEGGTPNQSFQTRSQTSAYTPAPCPDSVVLRASLRSHQVADSPQA